MQKLPTTLMSSLLSFSGKIVSPLLAKAMGGVNHSAVSEFVFLGLSNSWEIQLLLFLFSSVFYVVSLIGNLLIVFSVSSDPNLHSPCTF